MQITEIQLHQMMPNAGSRLDAHWPYINPALEWGLVVTPPLVAAFFAQGAHESGEYRYMEEIASGEAYEGRLDLGNTELGDGVKFKGRCPFQITGRANYVACGKALGLPLLDHPELIALPEYGTKAAVWFWNSRDLSILAGQGWFKTITRVVNGGYNGWIDRLNYYVRDLQILGLPPYTEIGEDRAIREVQRHFGLTVDGVAGPKTIAALRGTA